MYNQMNFKPITIYDITVEDEPCANGITIYPIIIGGVDIKMILDINTTKTELINNIPFVVNCYNGMLNDFLFNCFYTNYTNLVHKLNLNIFDQGCENPDISICNEDSYTAYVKGFEKALVQYIKNYLIQKYTIYKQFKNNCHDYILQSK